MEENKKIKFRGWDKAEKKMCEVEVISFRGGGCFLIGNSPSSNTVYPDGSIVFGPMEGHFVKFEDMVLMQYTGFNDEKGIDIYDGDIIEYDGKNYEVKMVNGCWQFDWDGGLDLGYAGPLKFVGNIYQNPELIK